jgi:hypothetical protein
MLLEVPYGVLPPEVPHLELQVLILHHLHIESDSYMREGILGTVCLTSLRWSLSAWREEY